VGIFLEEPDNILATRAARPGAMMRITTLQWAVGMFCALVGAMMLIVPHQFEAPVYTELHRHLSWWGAIFLIAGASLLAVAVFEPRLTLAFAGHLVAGVILLSLARGYAANGIWVRSVGYGILGAGTALAPFLSRAGDDRGKAYGRDLLALLLGMGMLLNGLAIFIAPDQFSGRFYDVIRFELPWYGVALTITGLLLVYLQVRPEFPRTIAPAVYLSAGGTLIMFLAHTSQRGWASFSFYGWFGSLLALLPWLDPALQRLKPTSLRVRLALVLIVAVAAPLIVAVSIVTDRAERSATAQALTLQRTIAAALADDISSDISSHRAGVAGLAKAISLSRMSPVEQAALLRTLPYEYVDFSSAAIYDVGLHPIVRVEFDPNDVLSGPPVATSVLRTNAPALTVRESATTGRRLFEFGAPLRRSDDSGAGVLVLSIDTAQIEKTLTTAGAQAGGQAFLVDQLGSMLVHPGLNASGFRDVSHTAPVVALRSRTVGAGALRYAGPRGEQLAGYAPVAGEGWGIIVERPLAVALAGAHAGRELAFVILLLMTGGAAVGGTIAASVLARPLEALARETKRLGEEGAQGTLPGSSIGEIRDLSATFGEMSARLAARTRERAAAEESLRRQNAYLAALHETALGLIKRLDLKDLLEAIVTRAGALVGTPDGHIYLVNPDTDELESKVAIGLAALLGRTRLKRGEGVAGRVWVSGEPLVIDDYDTWPHRVPGTPLGLHHAVAGIPLKSGEQILGVMNLRYKEPGRTFGAEALQQLGRFAQLAALALDNARLLGTLQEREARIRSIMDSTSDGFVFVGRDGQIKSISQKAIALLPRGGALVVGRVFAAALAEIDVRPAQREAVVAVLRSFLQGGDPTGQGDLEFSGGSRILKWDAQPARDDRGDIVGMTLTLQDVTHEREVSRMKSDFVSFVTHQLRTPLAGIKWMLELAAGTQDGAELQAYIQDARDANERLVNLVNDLLDISRLESGRLVISPQELHLGTMTQQVVDELAPLIKERGHRLSVTGAEAVPPVVADPQLLRQVVMNLISNAIKYTPSPGEIALEMQPMNGAVQWAIQDNGIGIPADSLPRLFEKFYRADNVHKIETEGTGLGLYLVRLIVDRFGGRIWCESEEGKGSTFLFTVPLSGGQGT
jgi:two-component system, OmpR family, phosphate regulon sensor histidine kinase PhoR